MEIWNKYPKRSYFALIAAILVLAAGIRVLTANDNDVTEAALPRIIYIAPANAPRSNLFAHNRLTSETVQLTHSEYGVEDYVVSPDGKSIAYSQFDERGKVDIWILDVKSGTSRVITNCVSANCLNPVWNHDGSKIAYERQDYDSGFQEIGDPHIWVVDVQTAISTLLIDDPHVVGRSPVYSPDGKYIAFYNMAIPAVMVYDLQAETYVLLQSLHGGTGDFSPDGKTFLYPVMVQGDGQIFYSQIESMNLATYERGRISGNIELQIEDKIAVWHPDGERIAVARRYFDKRHTLGAQVYVIDMKTGADTAITKDSNITNAGIAWSADGEWLVIQRVSVTVQNALPQIWVYSTQTGE